MFGFMRKRHQTAERWAITRELEAVGLLPDETERGGIVLGEWRDPKGERRLVRHLGAEHVLVVAPCRSGKTAGISVPTLLSWEDSVLVVDVKGESYGATGEFRDRVLGQRVLRFEPGLRDSARFNPLREIQSARDLVKEARHLCALLVNPDQREDLDHWTLAATGMLIALVLFVCLDEDSIGVITEASLATVLAILTDGGPLRAAHPQHPMKMAEASSVLNAFCVIREVAAHFSARFAATGFDEHAAHFAAWKFVEEIMEDWLDRPPQEFAGVVATGRRALTVFADPMIAAHTRESDFSIESLMSVGGKTSLYVTASPIDYQRHQVLAKIVVDMVIRRRLEGFGQKKPEGRLLLLIDDLGVFGRLPVLAEGLARFGGCAMTGVLVAQSIEQISKTYRGTEVGSVVASCGLQVAYTPSSLETAEFFARRTGISAADIMRTPQDEALLFMAGRRPFRCRKIKYYCDEPFKTRANSASG